MFQFVLLKLIKKELGMNYFRKLIKYMKDSYNIEHLFSLLKDGRKNPTYKTKHVMLILLIGFLLRIESLNELNNMLKEKEFKHEFPQKTRIPSVDTIRDAAKVIDLDGLKHVNDQIVKKAVKNKVYDKGTIDGYNVTAMDGTKFFGSNKKKCTDCLTIEKDGKTHSFHSGVVMSTIGEGPTLVLGFDMYKPGEDSTDKDEGELSVAKRLLSEVVSRQRNVIDIVVYDALACNSVWINHCISNQVDTVVRVKKNNNNSIKEVKKKTNKMEPVEVWADENGYQEIKVYESFFHMDNVEQNLRYVKYAMKDNNKKRTQIMIVTTCHKISLKSIYKMIRAR